MRLRILVACALCVAGCSGLPVKPSTLPERYRDFKIYSASVPAPGDPDRVVLIVRLHNEGDSPLAVRVRLEPSAAAGFAGGTCEQALAPGGATQWKLDLVPPDGFRHAVLKGEIAFGGVRARELYIALEGPDPGMAETSGARRLTDKATAVGTHAPRVRIDWWRSHPSSSLDSRQRRKPLITLAAKGTSGYAIAVEPMPRSETGRDMSLEQWADRRDLRPGEEDLIWAVEDLRRCLQVMSGGATLPVVRATGPGASAIRLRLNGERDWPHPDAYHLYTTPGGDVVIEAGHLDGLRHGIYGLLTDHLDCHWFLPRQLGEEIPRPGRVVVGQIDEERSPSFFSVAGMSWGNAPRWDRRNRCVVNGGRMSFGHAWGGYIPPGEEAYRAHPDWWARDREGEIRRSGTSYNTTNFCSTSPEVIEIVARKVNEIMSRPGVLVASLDPNDYGLMCLCDRCLALDEQYGVTRRDGTRVSDRLLHFSKEIYDRLDEPNKGKYLGILVYAYQMELPNRARPHDRHVGMVCNMTWTYDHTRPFNDPTSGTGADFLRLLKGWGRILPQFGFYDYYGHWEYFGSWGQVHKMREDLPAFRDLGGTFLVIEAQPNFAMQGLNLYIAARLAWDVDADVDVLMAELFTKFYGPAAEPMRRFWLAAERHLALTRPGPRAGWRVAKADEMWEELETCLTEAEQAAAGAERRFRDRVELHRAGFQYARHQRELQRHFHPGGDPDYEGAIALLRQRASWIEDLKKKFAPYDPYWPALLPACLYPNMNNLRAELEAKVRAAEMGIPDVK